MTLIKCPSCGRTVLSVASVCPTCSQPLTLERPPHTWQGTLTECRRCGHPVTTEASVCPHCGIRRPGRHVVSPVVLAGLAIVLLSTVTLGVVIPRLTPADHLPTAPPIQVTPPARHRVAAPKPDTIRAAVADSTPRVPAAKDTVTAVAAASPVAADSQPRDTTTQTVSAAETPAPATPASAPAGTQPRWVTDLWVNVHAWPADNSRIVGTLKPGQLVYAGEATRDGWQPVFVNGVRMGFVARSLLRNLPPSH